MPHMTVDPVVAASAVVMALQTLVSREISPLDGAVVTVSRWAEVNALPVPLSSLLNDSALP